METLYSFTPLGLHFFGAPSNGDLLTLKNAHGFNLTSFHADIIDAIEDQTTNLPGDPGASGLTARQIAQFVFVDTGYGIGIADWRGNIEVVFLGVKQYLPHLINQSILYQWEGDIDPLGSVGEPHPELTVPPPVTLLEERPEISEAVFSRLDQWVGLRDKKSRND